MDESTKCEHPYDGVDWPAMRCTGCGKSVLEILCREAYGPNWRKSIKVPDDVPLDCRF